MASPTLTQAHRSLQTKARLQRESRKFVTRLNDRYEQSPTVQSGVSAGKNLVVVNGQYYPAEGVDGAGGAVAVVNVGTPAVAKYAPPTNRSVVATTGTGLAGGGGGGGGGGTSYVAGSAIDIDGLNAINVKRDASGAIGLSGANGLMLNTGNGVAIVANALALALASVPALEYGSGADAGKLQVKVGSGVGRDGTGVFLALASVPGLEFGSSADAGKVQVKIDDGVQRTASGIGVKLQSPSGLVKGATGLAIDNAIAGAGLAIDAATKILSVGEGDGIDVLADTVMVDITELINYNFGLADDGSNNVKVNLDTNSGLQFNVTSGIGKLALGTPTTLSVISSSSITTSTHSHAITSSSDVGTTPVASILASNSSGQLTLAQLTIKGNLIFSGGDRNINASNSLYLTPSTDLVIDPGGLVLAPNAQELRTSTINDLPTGIDGWRLWNRYANYQQLTIGAIKADELYIRVFVADETRIDRGEEYWSKSFGIVQTDFTTPSVGGTVDVWFEDAPAATSFSLFSVNDYLLMRTIDWSTGLVVQKIWWQVTTAKLAQETVAINGVDRQQWRIRRIAGGLGGNLIKRGNLALDTGQIGQGWVHLSALSQDGGPFIQIGAMTSVSLVPQFTNYVRMGNLNGTVDYHTDVYGFAAGSGSLGLGTAPSAGFSGITAESTNGLRLFNTSIEMYSGSIKTISLTTSAGLNLRMDTAFLTSPDRLITWYDDIDSPSASSYVSMGAFRSGGGTAHNFFRTEVRSAANDAEYGVVVSLPGNIFGELNLSLEKMELDFNDGGGTTVTGAFVFMAGGQLLVAKGDFFSSTPASTFHVKESDSTTGAGAGITIEQSSTGDALLQFLLTGGRRWVVGIDNSDGDKLKFSNNAALGSADVFALDTTGNASFTNDVNIGDDLIVTSQLFVGTTTDTTPSSQLYMFKTAPSGLTDERGATIVLQGGSNNTAARTYTGLYLQTNPSGSGVGNVAEITLDVVARGTQSSGRTIAGRFSHDLIVGTRGLFGSTSVTPASPLHVYQSDTGVTTAVGITIEQGGTGDAKVQWLLSGGQRWGAGIDNSAADAFIISSGTDLASNQYFAITTAGSIGLGTSTPGVNVIGTTSLSGKVLQVDGGSNASVLALRSSTGAIIDMISTVAPTDQKWLQIASANGSSWIWAVDDSGGTAQHFMVLDHATGYIGVNKVSSGAAGAQMEIEAAGTFAARLTSYNSSSVFPLAMRRASGSQASPGAVANGDLLGGIAFVGYTSGGWRTVQSAEIDVYATEPYNTGTTGKGGAQIVFWTRINGGASGGNRMTIDHDGGVYIPYIWANAVNGTAVQINSNGLLTKATSSIRFKKNVRPMPNSFGDDFVMAMKPIVYNNKYGDDLNDYIGFIAEDIFSIGGAPFVSLNDDGLVESLHYDKLTVPLVGIAQRHHRRIAELEARVVELERMIR